MKGRGKQMLNPIQKSRRYRADKGKKGKCKQASFARLQSKPFSRSGGERNLKTRQTESKRDGTNQQNHLQPGPPSTGAGQVTSILRQSLAMEMFHHRETSQKKKIGKKNFNQKGKKKKKNEKKKEAKARKKKKNPEKV